MLFGSLEKAIIFRSVLLLNFEIYAIFSHCVHTQDFLNFVISINTKDGMTCWGGLRKEWGKESWGFSINAYRSISRAVTTYVIMWKTNEEKSKCWRKRSPKACLKIIFVIYLGIYLKIKLPLRGHCFDSIKHFPHKKT